MTTSRRKSSRYRADALSKTANSTTSLRHIPSACYIFHLFQHRDRYYRLSDTTFYIVRTYTRRGAAFAQRRKKPPLHNEPRVTNRIRKILAHHPSTITCTQDESKTRCQIAYTRTSPNRFEIHETGYPIRHRPTELDASVSLFDIPRNV